MRCRLCFAWEWSVEKISIVPREWQPWFTYNFLQNSILMDQAENSKAKLPRYWVDSRRNCVAASRLVHPDLQRQLTGGRRDGNDLRHGKVLGPLTYQQGRRRCFWE